jgi:sulfatase maturation enzyme AslB (radical SAM superfamily)
VRYSSYLRCRERGELTAIFHQLHPDPVYLKTDQWRSIRNRPSILTPALRRELRVRGLLVDNFDEDAEALTEARVELERRLDRASILYLIMSRGCNFACNYCPIPSLVRDKGEAYMSMDTLRAAIDSWVEDIKTDFAPDKDYAIIFYGGEPLLNREAVTAGVEHVRHLQAVGALPRANVKLMLSTNGVLLNTGYVRFLSQHDVSVAVGCDGPAEFHDAHRRAVNGQTTFVEVERSIRLLVAEGVQTFASVSVTPENLDHIENYSAFFENVGIVKFGFNFLRGKLLFTLIRREDLSAYYEWEPGCGRSFGSGWKLPLHRYRCKYGHTTTRWHAFVGCA